MRSLDLKNIILDVMNSTSVNDMVIFSHEVQIPSRLPLLDVFAIPNFFRVREAIQNLRGCRLNRKEGPIVVKLQSLIFHFNMNWLEFNSVSSAFDPGQPTISKSSPTVTRREMLENHLRFQKYRL